MISKQFFVVNIVDILTKAGDKIILPLRPPSVRRSILLALPIYLRGGASYFPDMAGPCHPIPPPRKGETTLDNKDTMI